MEESRATTRRLQKLGSSSLVVTLPKEWVKRLGLKPGDPVYVAVEGDTVRVVPVEGGSGVEARIRVRASKPRPEEAVRMLWCAYVLGPEEVHLDGAGDEVYDALKDAASSFIGVEVVREEDGVGIAILVDPSRVDVRASIRGVASDLQDVVGILRRAASGEQVGVEAEKARVRLQRSITLAERYLMGVLTARGPTVDAKTIASTPLATNFLGLAASTLLDAVRLVKDFELAAKKDLERILDLLASASAEAALNIATPSMKRSAEVLAKIERLKTEAETIIRSKNSTKGDAVLASKIYEALRHLHIATILIYCNLKTRETK